MVEDENVRQLCEKERKKKNRVLLQLCVDIPSILSQIKLLCAKYDHIIDMSDMYLLVVPL